MYDKDADKGKLKGQVLAAMPAMQDPNFKQTLIFVAEHNLEGSFGLVLNRPLEKKLGGLVKEGPLSQELSDVPVHYGGPVQPESLVVALFQMDLDSGEVTCQLNAPLEQAAAHLDNATGWVKAFAGYSGWGEGQLVHELDQDAWAICKPDPALFEPRFAGGLWAAYISGDQRWKKLIPFLPEDPEKN